MSIPWSMEVAGLAAAPGRACGPLVRNRPDRDPESVRAAILLARRAVPDDVGRLLLAAGTVSLGGALLSHVSLLSREFGKPSVTLAPDSGARWLDESSAALVELRAVGGGEARTLYEGEIVLLDGDGGRLIVASSGDAGTRAGMREIYDGLRRYDETAKPSVAERTLAAAGGPGAPGFYLLVEAAFVYGLLSPDRAEALHAMLARRLGEGVWTGFVAPIATRIEARVEAQATRILERLRGARTLDELESHREAFTRSVETEIARLRAMGLERPALTAHVAAARREASARRDSLAALLRRDLEQALGMSDDGLRTRIGSLHQLVRGSRAAGLDAAPIARLEGRIADLEACARASDQRELTVTLDAGTVAERELVGGKALGLLQARAALPAGWRLPAGFVVTTAAYERQLETGAGARLEQLLREERDPDAISRGARIALLSGSLPDEVEAAIRERVAALRSLRFAVRSSSTAEDGPQGSLAGLYDSYLGVQGVEELLRRIRLTWASLWNGRALRALLAKGLSPLHVRQAVVVQEMVQTRVAGVLLSRDPAGDPETAVVNAAWGLGEGIAQGDIHGDVFWISRHSGALLRQQRGADMTEIAQDPDRSGTIERPLGEDRRGVACLQQGDFEQLAELARSLEDASGRGQDIEFGLAADGSRVIFQARRLVEPHAG